MEMRSCFDLVNGWCAVLLSSWQVAIHRLVTQAPTPCLPKIAVANRDGQVVQSIIHDCVVADPVHRTITFEDIVERLSSGAEASTELASSGEIGHGLCAWSRVHCGIVVPVVIFQRLALKSQGSRSCRGACA